MLLVSILFGEDVEARKRAADVARRITEQSPEILWEFADEFAGLLASLDVEEQRTRWHLRLTVARVAHTPEQRMRAGRLMELLVEDKGNVVRCSAIEGIAVLGSVEASLREVAIELLMRALATGTKAERSRARHGMKWLQKRHGGPQ